VELRSLHISMAACKCTIPSHCRRVHTPLSSVNSVQIGFKQSENMHTRIRTIPLRSQPHTHHCVRPEPIDKCNRSTKIDCHWVPNNLEPNPDMRSLLYTPTLLAFPTSLLATLHCLGLAPPWSPIQPRQNSTSNIGIPGWLDAESKERNSLNPIRFEDLWEC